MLLAGYFFNQYSEPECLMRRKTAHDTGYSFVGGFFYLSFQEPGTCFHYSLFFLSGRRLRRPERKKSSNMPFNQG